MKLGEKIRSARLAAGLSQRQLCGDEITRNMLSLIENNAARPSMKTLEYLSRKLGKPLSWFLDDYDPETDTLPESAVSLRRAREALDTGRDIYASQLLQQVTAPELQREKLLLSARLPQASPEEICRLLPSLDQELLLRAEAALNAGNPERCAGLLGAVEDQASTRWLMLRGRLCLARGEFSPAAGYFHRAEEALPAETAPLLEQCYRELGNFRRAYDYACRQKRD